MANAPRGGETEAGNGDRVIAFLFTDIESSTEHAQRFPEGMRSAHLRHDEIFQKAAQNYGGDLFASVGDGFKVAFGSALAAVQAAFEAQRAMQTVFVDDAGTIPLRARAAIHAGETEERGGEYIGLTPARAQRLLEIINGGQIVLTGATAEMVKDALPNGATLQDIGELKLRTFFEPDRLFQVVHPDLPANFPTLRPTDTVPNNLPNQLSHLVGRERETDEIRQRVLAYPLVTLTGAGGSGKTRLALHVADRFLRKFRDGVWFIDLSHSDDAESIARVTASVLGIKPDADAPLTGQIVAHLADKRCLLILDNCERLIEAAAAFAAELLRTCKDARILATSREALSIGGEALYPVRPLPVPPDDERDPKALMINDAVRLFGLQAGLKSPLFALNNENVFAVARICRRLDGVPLMVRLMASWADTLTPEQMEKRMQEKDRFKFPVSSGDDRFLPERHLSTRDCIVYSLDLLTESERALLRRLAIFSGGFTLEAAEEICEGDPVDEVLISLNRLLRKSLVETDDTPFGKRYHLLNPIREFALELLAERNELAPLRTRHRDYFVQWAEAIAPRLIGPEMYDAIQVTETEMDNLRLALATSGTITDGMKIFASIAWYWYVRGHIREGINWADHFLRLDNGAPIESDALRALVRNRAGILYWYGGRLDAARLAFMEALNIYRAIDDSASIAKCLSNLGSIACKQGFYAESSQYHEESLAIYEKSGAYERMMDVLVNLGANAVEEEDYDLAQTRFEQVVRMQSDHSNHFAYAGSLQNLATIARKKSDFNQAKRFVTESLSLQREINYEAGILYCLCEALLIAFDEGRWDAAAVLFGYLDQYRQGAESAGVLNPATEDKVLTEAKEIVRKKIGNARYEAQEMKGRSLNAKEHALIAQLGEEEIL